MMMLPLLLVMLSLHTYAYVPTVESLFRHGANPDVTTNGVSVTFLVKRLDFGKKNKDSSGVSLLAENKKEDFYKLFFTRVNNDLMKVAQTRYANSSFSESSLLEKVYYPSFSNFTIKATPEEAEKGLFHAMMRSIIFNDGEFLVNYLKALGVPVKLNKEILKREKIELLVAYKQYLAAINKDRTSRKTEVNPLKPQDSAARERADALMSEPMYVDLKQVKLSRENDQMAWLINAAPFEAVVSYNNRHINKIKFKSQSGEMEIVCKDYWLANGSHSMPRYMMIRDFRGETYQLEVMSLRHYLEKEGELMSRLKNWDNLLKGKESLEPKPAFVL
jgi:hypothetical protein